MKKSPVRPLIFNVLSFLIIVISLQAQADTQFYFIRHAEIDFDDRDKPLTEEGKARADALVGYMKGKDLTHIYATHFNRNRDTVLPLSKDRTLEIIQVPRLGSTVDGDEVTNRSKGKIATQPMIEALNGIPDGSLVLVTANSGNLFKIMTGVGVVSGSDEMPCESKSCFPRDEFNNVWLVNKTVDGVSLKKSQY